MCVVHKREQLFVCITLQQRGQQTRDAQLLIAGLFCSTKTIKCSHSNGVSHRQTLQRIIPSLQSSERELNTTTQETQGKGREDTFVHQQDVTVGYICCTEGQRGKN